MIHFILHSVCSFLFSYFLVIFNYFFSFLALYFSLPFLHSSLCFFLIASNCILVLLLDRMSFKQNHNKDTHFEVQFSSISVKVIYFYWSECFFSILFYDILLKLYLGCYIQFYLDVEESGRNPDVNLRNCINNHTFFA